MSIEGIHSETALLLEIAQGDRESFGVLYTEYFPYVKQYVSLFAPGQALLDELTQDVFVRIWEKRDKLREVESFKKYLFMVCRNVVFNFMRAMKVQRQMRELDESTDRGSDDMENELLFRQYYQIAMDAIELLPAGRKRILKMSIDDGLTLDEIAEQLDISRAGVKKQLYTATAFVRQYLQDHGEMTVLLFVFLSLFEL